MALWEDVQVFIDDTAGESDAAVEEAIKWCLSGIPGWHSDRKEHNSSGWFADYAWSEKCLTAGHVRPAGDSDGYFDPRLDDDLYMDGTHVSGWDGDILCTATKWGTCCTECESDQCEFNFGKLGVNLWEMVSAR